MLELLTKFSTFLSDDSIRNIEEIGHFSRISHGKCRLRSLRCLSFLGSFVPMTSVTKRTCSYNRCFVLTKDVNMDKSFYRKQDLFIDLNLSETLYPPGCRDLFIIY